MLHISPTASDDNKLRKRVSDPLVAGNHSALFSPNSELETSRKLSSPMQNSDKTRRGSVFGILDRKRISMIFNPVKRSTTFLKSISMRDMTQNTPKDEKVESLDE